MEFSVNFLIGADTFQIKQVLGMNVNYNAEANLNLSAGFSLLGKIPFRIRKFTLAPALGVEYRFMVLRVAADFLDDNETVPNVFNAPYNTFIIKLGGIVDFDLTDRLYLRGNILGCLCYSLFTNGFFYKDATGGVQFQLGIGYRL